MLSTLLIAMGVCASCGISEQEKAEQERQAAAEQRRLVVEASEPVRLLSTSPEFELAAYEANTVLEVLEIRAEQIGLPKAAAVWLKLEFSGAIIAHHNALKEAGLCDQAEISVQGEDEAKAKLKEQADKVNIHDAALDGNTDEVQLVLDFYPDRVNAKNQTGYTPLHNAALNNQCEVAQILIAAGADPNTSFGATPLHDAAMRGHCEVAQILITAGADLDAQNNYGETPLHDAATRGQCKVAKILITAGADLNAKESRHGQTPLYYAATGWNQSDGKYYKYPDMVKLLKAAGAH